MNRGVVDPEYERAFVNFYHPKRRGTTHHKSLTSDRDIIDGKEQKRMHRTAKKSCSSLQTSSIEHHGNSKLHGSSNACRVDTATLVDSLMEEIKKYFEQVQAYCEKVSHAPTNGPKEDTPSSPTLIERMPMHEEKCEFPRENLEHKVNLKVDELPQECTAPCDEVKDLNVIVQNEEIHEHSSCSNTWTFAIFNTSCFTQVGQGQVTLVIPCAISKSFVQFESFHGIYLFGVTSMWSRFVQALEFNTDQIHEEGTEVAIQVDQPAFGATLVTYGYDTEFHKIDFLGVESPRTNFVEVYQLKTGRANGKHHQTHSTCDMPSYCLKDGRELKPVPSYELPFVPKLMWILHLCERHVAWIIFMKVMSLALSSTIDSWTNLFQEEGNDAILSSHSSLLIFEFYLF